MMICFACLLCCAVYSLADCAGTHSLEEQTTFSYHAIDAPTATFATVTQHVKAEEKTRSTNGTEGKNKERNAKGKNEMK